MMCARDEENKKLFFFSLSLFKEEEEEDEPRSMDEFFVVFLGNFCRRLFFYFLIKMDQCENLWLSIAFGTHIQAAAKRRRSLCVAEINKHRIRKLYAPSCVF